MAWDKIRIKMALSGVSTALGLAQRGFFIPFKYASSVPVTPSAYRPFETTFEAQAPAMQAVLDAIEQDASALSEAVRGPLANHWQGGYFSALDTAAGWAVVRQNKPKRIVEVGSGSSTHVMCAASAHSEQSPQILCIDPVPRSEISALGVEWEAGILSDDHIGLFEALEPGDIAFFDSSHVLFQGTDVDIIYNRIIPALKPGVIVHIHDIFLPDPYPESWAHRAYTEQLALSGWLCSGACETLFSSHYAATRMADKVSTAMRNTPKGQLSGGSLWFRR